MLRRSLQRPRRGSALLVALVTVVVLGTLAAAGLTLGQAGKREAARAQALSRALYLAEAGVNEALAVLEATHGERVEGEPMPTVGTAEAPRVRRSGSYRAEIAQVSERLYRVRSQGNVDRVTRRVEVLVAEAGGGIFHHAVFAGNRAGDDAYVMPFGGGGESADLIDGDVFSGGDLLVEGDASITGEVRARGTIDGTSGTEGVEQPLPDLAAMDYAANADYDVAALFAAATWQADDAGGSAWQLPDGDPGHIFRKNPDNRGSEIGLTTKDDYFLEDPWATLAVDREQDGSDPYEITLSGTSGADRVYYVDGNLWLHNTRAYSFRFVNEDGSPVRVVFVASGNVYFSDNLFYGDPDQDGVVFIAMADENEPDSGNVYFGDPMFGTLKSMDAFLYAERDFIDHNLDALGSKNVRLRGIMSAGEKVRIQRDFVDALGEPVHSRLEVVMDDRIASGALELKGIPGTQADGARYRLVSWREAEGN